ncbi:MAG: hypothetical protein EXR93_08390 [Gemmatimonadetes bacterium]|nr:hypothetical protein [Gemmatimonadota bacterium]
MRAHRCLVVLIGLALAASRLVAQARAGVPTAVIPGAKVGGSANVRVLSHIPMGGLEKVADLDIEQELARPYVYVSQLRERAGFQIVSLRDLGNIRTIYSWRIENIELHRGNLGWGGKIGRYFKLKGRYYYAQSFEFGAGSVDQDLGAIVFDVTGLPDTNTIKERARIRAAGALGGFHNLVAYKHSDGRVLVFTTVRAPRANIYDMEKVIAGQDGLIGSVPVPEQPGGSPLRGYHDFFLGYDPVTHQDKFYGAGAGGYYIYDVTKPEDPKLIASITGTSGVTGGHTITPTPDHRYVVTETEYQYAPLRFFDLKPALDGQVKTISRPIGAWNFDWQDLPHNHEVRWPYVFVSSYEDGLSVVNMMDPTNPYTVGYYYTCQCQHEVDYGPLMDPPTTSKSVMQGAWGVDVRNADGVIVIGDVTSGFWALKMEGFDGWNGHQWGLPNMSSAQDWDNGPEGAPKPQKVSSSR